MQLTNMYWKQRKMLMDCCPKILFASGKHLGNLRIASAITKLAFLTIFVRRQKNFYKTKIILTLCRFKVNIGLNEELKK
jgi:hypothetical protein